MKKRITSYHAEREVEGRWVPCFGLGLTADDDLPTTAEGLLERIAERWDPHQLTRWQVVETKTVITTKVVARREGGR